MTIITSKYRSDTVRLFVDDVDMNDYYLFVSSTSNTAVTNTSLSKSAFLEKTLFGKKIQSENVFYMIRNSIWTAGNVYVQYDDTVDISEEKYYAVVYPANNETGDYKIYKCLFNNYGATSEDPPNYNVNTPDQIYEMTDGYIWKLMYSISVADFDKYSSRGFIPIISANTEVVSDTSSIDQIYVENPDENRGYESVSGTIYQVIRGAESEVVISPQVAGSLSAIENYYAGYSLYVENNNTQSSQVYTVNTYTYNSGTGRATINLNEGTPIDGVLLDNSEYTLLPRIDIRGDGTGAVAIPNVSTDGVITSITLLNSGSGYKRAIASVPDPYAFDPETLNSLDSRVILRPILSPLGGHGSNLVDELSCRRCLVYTEFTGADNVSIPTSNQFASVGIVKNPEFKVFPYPDIFDNRIELALDTNPFSTNEIITQIETNHPDSDFYNETRFQAKVHEVSGDFIYVCEYMGAFPNDIGTYANTDFSDISLDVTLPLISSLNQVITINIDNNPAYTGGYDATYPGFKLSPYVQRSGEVYYMNRFIPITRTVDSREQLKIILEF